MKLVKALVAFFKNRGKEGSSWGSVALVLAYFGLSADQSSEVVDLLIAAYAVVQWAIPDNILDKIKSVFGSEEEVDG